MRSLVRLVSSLLVRSQTGRWVLSSALLLSGALSCIAGVASSRGQTQTQTLSFLIAGVLIFALGLVVLVATIRIGSMRKRAIAARTAGVARAEELVKSGQILPIPALPPARKDITPEMLAHAEGYAQRMATLPWGDKPSIPADQIHQVFNATVARVQSVTGDWRELGAPIDIFVGLPRPLCFVGAAEVMYLLSYLRSHTYAPNGLLQGLRFIARAQFTEPRQPDALVIRTKLLAGGASEHWLELADATLALLVEVAPNHPRLPEAKMAIHVQRGEYEAALACAERVIVNSPSPEEAYIALTRRADLLLDMKRYGEAVTAYDGLLSQRPGNPWTWHNKSIALMGLGRYDEAQECNIRARSIMDSGAARNTRERILAKLAEASGPATFGTPEVKP